MVACKHCSMPPKEGYKVRHNAGKTLTPKLMDAVEGAFIAKFGPYAGWAHNVLFISDLATSRQYLPPHLQPDRPASAAKGSRKAAKRDREEGEIPSPQGTVS